MSMSMSTRIRTRVVSGYERLEGFKLGLPHGYFGFMHAAVGCDLRKHAGVEAVQEPLHVVHDDEVDPL